ncbi:MAG TPA: mechanosensitive ion channel family protein [Bryobacteraceae bacterium]|nr:mechanosensitive ion channel family protein [Bryobacteraceae bacterium]
MPVLRQILQDPFALIVPVVLFGATVLAGLILRKILFGVVRRWAAHTDSHLDVLVIESLRGPIVLWSIILGIHIATQSSEIPARYQRYIHPALDALWVWALTVAASRFAGNAVRFYGGRVTGAQSVTSLTQKLVQLAVVGLGIVWVLKVVFDLSLTPLITTLGVGGLAVALALQDTLSNLFAGFYVSISGLVRMGDYIKLSSGEEGYVQDISWRCTTMRTLANNLIVIPNNKLGQAIYTNYYLPEPRMGMSVSFGVGYESDIDRVEKILLQETIAAAGKIAGLLADPPPSIRFNPGPGDWSLVFQVNFSVAQFVDQYLVQSELRKLLFKRLLREGISMPFPTRTVVLETKQPT